MVNLLVLNGVTVLTASPSAGTLARSEPETDHDVEGEAISVSVIQR